MSNFPVYKALLGSNHTVATMFYIGINCLLAHLQGVMILVFREFEKSMYPGHWGLLPCISQDIFVYKFPKV